MPKNAAQNKQQHLSLACPRRINSRIPIPADGALCMSCKESRSESVFPGQAWDNSGAAAAFEKGEREEKAFGAIASDNTYLTQR